MKICTEFEKLKPILEKAQIAEDTTFSLIFIPESLDFHDIIAIRTAKKWCDVAICVSLSKKITAKQHKILQDAGVDILISCPQNAPTLSLNSGEINSGFILKIILAIMPSAVAIQLAKIDLLKVLLKINANYPDMFTPIYSETPVNILSKTQQDIRSIMVGIKEIAISGENNSEKLNIKFNSILEQKYSTSGLLEFVDNKGKTYKNTTLNKMNFLHIYTTINGIKITDGIQK